MRPTTRRQTGGRKRNPRERKIGPGLGWQKLKWQGNCGEGITPEPYKRGGKRREGKTGSYVQKNRGRGGKNEFAGQGKAAQYGKKEDLKKDAIGKEEGEKKRFREVDKTQWSSWAERRNIEKHNKKMGRLKTEADWF